MRRSRCRPVPLPSWRRTGQPYEKVKRDSDRDYYMSAQEAKEYGLIEVLEAEPAASATIGEPEAVGVRKSS